MSDEKDDDEIMNRIQIYSNDDEKLKFLGQMLSNDTSRKILQTLLDKELTSSEISFHTGFSLPLINHHVNTMLQSGIVTVTKTTLNTKNQPMKYYSAKLGIIILPKQASHLAKKSKSLAVTLKTIMKFTSIGLAGVVSYFVIKINQESELSSDHGNYPSSFFTQNELSLIIVPLTVVGIGLLVQYVLNKKRRNN